jgi:hypothetical protein
MTAAEKIEIATEYDALSAIERPTGEQDRRMSQILAALLEQGVKVDAYLDAATADIEEERPAITLAEWVTRTAG